MHIICSDFDFPLMMDLSPPGQYPGEQGIVAPGMSCQFAVKFAPDSLTDYVDKIQVNIFSKRRISQDYYTTVTACNLADV